MAEEIRGSTGTDSGRVRGSDGADRHSVSAHERDRQLAKARRELRGKRVALLELFDRLYGQVDNVSNGAHENGSHTNGTDS